jgi:hypothetical protein
VKGGRLICRVVFYLSKYGEYRNYDKYRGKYWECRKEYEKLLEIKCKRWQDKKVRVHT